MRATRNGQQQAARNGRQQQTHTHTHILHTTPPRHEHVLVPAFAIYAPEQVPYAIERYSKEVKVRQALRM